MSDTTYDTTSDNKPFEPNEIAAVLCNLDFSRPFGEIVREIELLDVEATRRLAQRDGAVETYTRARDTVCSTGKEFMDFIEKHPQKVGSEKGNAVFLLCHSLRRLILFYQSKLDQIEHFRCIESTDGLTKN